MGSIADELFGMAILASIIEKGNQAVLVVHPDEEVKFGETYEA